MAYAAWSVIAGEQPTAAKWNILGTNDASFNDGTGIGTNVLDQSKVNWTTTGQVWWQEIARATAGSTVASITTATFTSKKYLLIRTVYLPTSSLASGRLQFNGDTANNYSYRVSDNGAADTTGTLNGVPTDTGSGDTAITIGDFYVVDVSGQEKPVAGTTMDSGAGTGVANITKRRESVGKWTGTGRITTATLQSASANMGSGSEIIVLGHD